MYSADDSSQILKYIINAFSGKQPVWEAPGGPHAPRPHLQPLPRQLGAEIPPVPSGTEAPRDIQSSPTRSGHGSRGSPHGAGERQRLAEDACKVRAEELPEERWERLPRTPKKLNEGRAAELRAATSMGSRPWNGSSSVGAGNQLHATSSAPPQERGAVK